MVPKVSTLQLLSLKVILQAVSWCQAEVYTAISGMEPLLETHKWITDGLDLYIKTETRKVHTLKKHLDLYKQEYLKALKDLPNYMGNQSNALALTKRLETDLDIVEDSVRIGTDYIKNISMNDEGLKYPKTEDLTGAAQALVRLQQTYQLNVTDLAEGILHGVLCSKPMTIGDCYELARALYNHKDVKNSLTWMMEAYRKFREEEDKETLPFTEVDIVEHIEFSYNSLCDTKSGRKWANHFKSLHSRAFGKMTHFEKVMEEEEAGKGRRRRGDIRVPKEDSTAKFAKKETKSFYPMESSPNFTNIYEAHCRDELDVAPNINKRLKCWFSSEHHPFLKYAPIKVEQMYITPDIFIYHDVLYDSEIEIIKSIAKPNFTRAFVLNPGTGEAHWTGYRISKISWIKNEEHPVIARISQRVTDMTGLDMETAEELQVANYGIGGHYEPHYDFSKRQESQFPVELGNRIATVLFYMSEVAQGGATVFTKLGLSVFPIKGAALFWMNLHPSGEGDLATSHGACPVLRGSKWVCTKWIHQCGQELIKPCTLEYQEEGIKGVQLSVDATSPIPKSSR